MAEAPHLQPAVCPACVAMPPAEALVAGPKGDGAEEFQFSLPTIHCAACISSVERGLMATPGVRAARVNLSLKRVRVTAEDREGMEDFLLNRLNSVGYAAYPLDAAALMQTTQDQQGRDLLMRLAVAGFAAMNVMLLSVAVWAGAQDATRDFMHWVSAAIAIPAVAFAGVPFFKNAWSALRAHRLNMDVPISLALVLSAGMSLFETSVGGEHAYFDAALSLTFFLLAGRYLDHRTRVSARSAAAELAALEVPRAQRLTGDEVQTVAISDLTLADVVLVSPGMRVPVDGEVLSGKSEIDRSLLSGETNPVFIDQGMAVHAGEANLTGALHIRVTALGRDTVLQKMTELVAVAEAAKNKYTTLADRASQIYAPGVHLLALVALVVWLVYSGDIRLSLNIATAVLIITCPCALGLAVPAVMTAASGRLFRKGILLKDGAALERLAQVDEVVFDKTGTLTLGEPRLIQNQPALTHLGLAAGLAQGSNHPLAKSLVKAAQETGTPIKQLSDLQEVPGFGIQARYQGRMIRLGRANWVGAQPTSQTATWLKFDNNPPVAFLFEDQVRTGAQHLIRDLHAKGIPVTLLSGDLPEPVHHIATALGIQTVISEALPDEKARLIADKAKQGRRVLMVGDGLNDTAALASAYVSISPASAIDAARTASDIVLLQPDLAHVGFAMDMAKSSTRRIKENFAIAALYNLIAVPFALLGFATPLMAALAMSTSSITVSLNALRLKGK